MKVCFTCKKEVSVQKPGRGDECPHCGADLKVCLNCRFFDQMSYNECSEPNAERVLDKDRANYCEYFEFRDTATGLMEEDPTELLKNLFKK